MTDQNEKELPILAWGETKWDECRFPTEEELKEINKMR